MPTTTRIGSSVLTWIPLGLLAAGWALTGCSSDAASIGERENEAETGGAGSGSGEEIWTGYFEAFEFENGVSTFTMELTRDNGTVTGTVTYGDDPAPPVDPDVGYPPGYPYASRTVVNGVSHEIMDGTASGNRVTFTIEYGRQWTDWCALQTPVLIYEQGLPGTDYHCAPLTGVISREGSECFAYNPVTYINDIPIDCGKGDLCNEVCTCDAMSCTYDSYNRPSGGSYKLAYYQKFDLALSDAQGNGTIQFYIRDEQPDITVRLQRMK